MTVNITAEIEKVLDNLDGVKTCTIWLKDEKTFNICSSGTGFTYAIAGDVVNDEIEILGGNHYDVEDGVSSYKEAIIKAFSDNNITAEIDEIHTNDCQEDAGIIYTAIPIRWFTSSERKPPRDTGIRFKKDGHLFYGRFVVRDGKELFLTTAKDSEPRGKTFAADDSIKWSGWSIRSLN